MTTEDVHAAITDPALVASGRKIPDLYQIAALMGFLGAIAGLAAAVVGVRHHNVWGFVTSGASLWTVVGCLLCAGALSWWASTRTDGGWKVLARAGMAVSICGLVIVVAIAASAMLRDNWPRVANQILKRSRRGYGLTRIVKRIVRSALR